MTGEFGVTRTPPSGAIAIWADDVEDIPAGWVLCDGNNGTPYLVGKFLQNVPDASTDPGSTGGTESKSLTVAEMPAHTHGHDAKTSTDGQHTHGQTADSDALYEDGGYRELINRDERPRPQTSTAGSHSHASGISNTGGGSAFDNNPPYYTVAFIMKQ